MKNKDLTAWEWVTPLQHEALDRVAVQLRHRDDGARIDGVVRLRDGCREGKVCLEGVGRLVAPLVQEARQDGG